MLKKIKRIIVLISILSAGALLAVGVNIAVKFRAIHAHIDPRFVDGKLYRRPVHPGFIAQRLPSLTSRIAVKKGPHEKGLATVEKYREN